MAAVSAAWLVRLVRKTNVPPPNKAPLWLLRQRGPEPLWFMRSVTHVSLSPAASDRATSVTAQMVSSKLPSVLALGEQLGTVDLGKLRVAPQALGKKALLE